MTSKDLKTNSWLTFVFLLNNGEKINGFGRSVKGEGGGFFYFNAVLKGVPVVISTQASLSVD